MAKENHQLSKLGEDNRALSLRGLTIRLRESPNIVPHSTLVPQELNICTVDLDAAFLSQFDILLTSERCEAPVLADDDLLAAGELIHGAAECLDGGRAVDITCANAQEDLADVHAGDDAVRLAQGSSHTGLQSIGSGTRQHLVDADDVVGVSADAEVEAFLAGDFNQVSKSQS